MHYRASCRRVRRGGRGGEVNITLPSSLSLTSLPTLPSCVSYTKQVPLEVCRLYHPIIKYKNVVRILHDILLSPLRREFGQIWLWQHNMTSHFLHCVCLCHNGSHRRLEGCLVLGWCGLVVVRLGEDVTLSISRWNKNCFTFWVTANLSAGFLYSEGKGRRNYLPQRKRQLSDTHPHTHTHTGRAETSKEGVLWIGWGGESFVMAIPFWDIFGENEASEIIYK